MGLNLGDTQNAQNGGVTEPQQRSIWGIIIDVFVSPTRAFSDYKKKPVVIVPLILAVILAAISGAVMAPYQAKMQVEMFQQSTTLPPQVLEQARQSAENPNYVLSAVLGGFFGILLSFLLALLAWGIGTFLFGGTTKFKGIWGVCLLAGLISEVIAVVIKLPLIIAKGSPDVSFGLAALMPTKYTSLLYLFLTYMDAIAIWVLIVAGIGLSIQMGISRGKGIATSVITTGVILIGGLGLQIFGMSFAGVEFSLF